MSLRWVGISLLLAASTLSMPAVGDTPPGASAASGSASAAVADHVRRGDQARVAARWSDAVSAYRAALAMAAQAALSPAQRAAILGELGVSELALGKHRDAAEHLHASLEQREAFTPEQQRRFEQAQKKAERETGLIFISVNPPDAEVLVDGTSLGARRASYVVFVEPGSHVVRGRLAGYGDFVATVDAPRGNWQGLGVDLSKLPQASEPQAASSATSTTWSRGRHTRRRAPRGAAPAPNRDTAQDLRAVGFTVAAVGVGLGAAFAIAGEVLDGQVAERAAALGADGCVDARSSAACRNLRELNERRDAVDRVSTVSFIAGAVIGTVTVSSFLWAPREGATPPIQVRATAGNRVGATVDVAW